MKAAAYKKQNEVGVIEAPVPSAGPGQVVLKVHNCGICGSDLHAVQFGTLRADCIMGHEFCGEVHEVGQGVRGFTVGERVASLPWITCGNANRARAARATIAVATASLGWGSCRAAMPNT